MTQDPTATQELLLEVLEYVMDSEAKSYDEHLAEHFPQYADATPNEDGVLPDLLDPQVKHIYKSAVLLSQEYFGDEDE